jgi:SAM-dependent methyltransferase
LAPPRVQQYLAAEIEFVSHHIDAKCTVLELGCGYGRVLVKLARTAKHLIGIDLSPSSLDRARQLVESGTPPLLAVMNATNLGLRGQTVDVVVCIQNGIAVFDVDPAIVLREAIRVTRPGGYILLSSYSDHFWTERLEWFELQAREGLIGEIDDRATGDGTIVCRDGFRARTLRPRDFESLAARFDVSSRVVEVDRSSVFCEIVVG